MKKILQFLFGQKSEKNTHKPGTFSSGSEDYMTLSPVQRKRFGLDATLIEYKQEDLDRVFPTQHLQIAFKQMSAMTFPKISALNQKRATVFEVREKNILSPERQLNGMAVYIGSGTDIEYPLCMGMCNIFLVDPCLCGPRMVDDLVNRVEQIIGKGKVTRGNGQISFIFDSKSSNPEIVVVHLVDRHARIGPVAPTQGAYILNSDTKIFLLLAFASGGYIDEDQKLLDAVEAGGYIIASVSSSKDDMISHGFTDISEPLSQGVSIFKKM